MIRFYTYLFACAYVNAERQWKSTEGPGFHVFVALGVVSLTVMFNIGAVFGTIPIVLGLPHFSSHVDRNVGVLSVIVLGCLCWLAFVRNGNGVRLAEELKKKGEDSIIKCQLVSFGTLFGSVAMFMIPLFIVAFGRHPAPSQIHSDGSYSSSAQSQAR
jgi:hypothetical protein